MKIPRVLILLCCLPIAAAAEDLETLTHNVYKNITIMRTEPDGIVVQHSAGIVKVPFDELPDGVRARFPYDPAAAKEFARKAAQQQADLAMTNLQTKRRIEEQQKKIEEEGQHRRAIEKAVVRAAENLPSITMRAVVEPITYGEERTTASIHQAFQIETGSHFEALERITEYKWVWSESDRFIGVIEEPMSHAYEAGDRAVLVLYKIGHTEDAARHPRFTTNRQKALRFLAGLSID